MKTTRCPKLTAAQVAFLSSLLPRTDGKLVARMGWNAGTTKAMVTSGHVVRTETPEGFGRYALTGMGRLELDLATGTWEAA